MKSHLLDAQIGFQVFKLLRKGDHWLVGEVCRVCAKITGEIVKHPLRLRRIAVTEILDGAEGVVDKMRVCLQNHRVEPCLRQLHFFEKQLTSALMVLVEKDQVHGYHRAEKRDRSQKIGMTE